MKRRLIVGLLAAGMSLSSSAPSFSSDRSRGSLTGPTMGPRTAAEFYMYQHGQPPPVQTTGREGISGTPLLGSRPVSPPANGHSQTPMHPSTPNFSQPGGHWESTWVWVPERRQEVWIWGHFENGYWVNGHYGFIVYPGYYQEQRVWVGGMGHFRR